MYENCMTSIFSIHLMSNYQTLIMACINTTYKRNRNSQRFEKKNSSEKEKKPILSYPGLRYAHRKLNFACRIFFFRKMFVCVQNSICGRKKTLRKKFGLWLKKNFLVEKKNFQNNLKKFAYKIRFVVEKENLGQIFKII